MIYKLIITMASAIQPAYTPLECTRGSGLGNEQGAGVRSNRLTTMANAMSATQMRNESIMKCGQ